MLKSKFRNQITTSESLLKLTNNGVLMDYLSKRNHEIFCFGNKPFVFGSWHSYQIGRFNDSPQEYLFQKILHNG